MVCAAMTLIVQSNLRFSNIFVFKQFGSQPSYSWEKSLSRLTKLWVSSLYLTTLSCPSLYDQSCVSQATQDIWFSNKSLLKVFWNKVSSRTEVPLYYAFILNSRWETGIICPFIQRGRSHGELGLGMI